MATTKIPQKLLYLQLYEVHIWYDISLGQWQLATHLVAMVAWLPWQPQYVNSPFSSGVLH